MCGLFGYISYRSTEPPENLDSALHLVRNRGRDAIGISYFLDVGAAIKRSFDNEMPVHLDSDVMLCNMRAQPTSNSEWVKKPEPWMVQPYVRAAYNGFVGVIHNGTIANDQNFNKNFNMLHEDGIDEFSMNIDSSILMNFDSRNIIPVLKKDIVGSYAMAMYDQEMGCVTLAKNYMPLHILIDYDEERIYFASEEAPLMAIGASRYQLIDVPAYSYIRIPTDDFEGACNKMEFFGSLLPEVSDRALVVCSGGLDSTTALTQYVRKMGNENVEVLHYHYGCKAEDAEKDAIIKIGDRLGVKVNFIDLTHLFKTFLSSPLTDDSIKITEGDEGIEYAKEWVPARNLILMSMAIGFAEKHGFSIVAIGANLTEQAAYPDNSLDFIQKLNAVAQYSVQNGVPIRVEAPLVNMMKQEIVELALDIEAPLDLMTSCYKPIGDIQCGVCGPCTMRLLAFKMLGLEDNYKEYAK